MSSKINIPDEFKRFCKDNDIEDRNDTREIALKSWNWGVNHILSQLLMPDGIKGHDNCEIIRGMRETHTIVEEYPHPDYIAMVEATAVKQLSSIQEMVDDILKRYSFMKEDEIRKNFKEFIDSFQGGDIIIEYDNIRPLSGSRGYALSRNGKIIDGKCIAIA